LMVSIESWRNTMRYFRLMGVGTLLALVGFGVWIVHKPPVAHAAEAGAGKETPAPAPATLPQSVEVVKPGHETMARTLNVPATIEAFETADLYAKALGYIAEVRADIGDHVKAGQILATIDMPEVQNDLAEAKAQKSAK